MNKKYHSAGITLVLLMLTIVWYLMIDYKTPFILHNVRLPRFFLTLLTGMILAGTGSVFQVMLNNPLADPYILGVSSGAALGSILAGLAGIAILSPVFGFSGALLSILIVWALSRAGGHQDRSKLLFAGIVFSMFCSAFISLIMYLNKNDIMLIMQVLMGNLGHIFSQTEWIFFLIMMIISAALMVVLYKYSNHLNILSSGEVTAQTLGLDVKRFRKIIFFTGSVLTGISVAYAGIIGFVGLIIPHFVRMMTGNNQKRVFLYSVLYGAIFLLLSDLLASHLTVVELPVGIITSFIGCPVFLYILILKKK